MGSHGGKEGCIRQGREGLSGREGSVYQAGKRGCVIQGRKGLSGRKERVGLAGKGVCQAGKGGWVRQGKNVLG